MMPHHFKFSAFPPSFEGNTELVELIHAALTHLDTGTATPQSGGTGNGPPPK